MSEYKIPQMKVKEVHRHLIEGTSAELCQLYEIEDSFPLDQRLLWLADRAYTQGMLDKEMALKSQTA